MTKTELANVVLIILFIIVHTIYVLSFLYIDWKFILWE